MSAGAIAQAPQWNDFPGGRTVDFSGHTWRIKGPGVYGPGPNYFADTAPNVELLDDGTLALRITNDGIRWRSVEVVLEEALGYGEYRFQLYGPVDVIDPNAVLGLFLWEYQESYEGFETSNVANEFDIELSRWGEVFAPNGQFVAQPYQLPGNRERFSFSLGEGGAPMSVSFDWGPDEVRCFAWRGHAAEPTPGTLIHSWVYSGADIPLNEEPRLHMNLWLLFGNAPLSGESVEALIAGFGFEPRCRADVNRDGSLNGLDYGAWLGAFNAGDARADQNADGAINGLDFGAWLGAFNAGCGEI